MTFTFFSFRQCDKQAHHLLPRRAQRGSQEHAIPSRGLQEASQRRRQGEEQGGGEIHRRADQGDGR